jgi:hypothetical protein
MTGMAGYWVFLAFWALTVPAGLVVGYGMAGGDIEFGFSSIADLIAFAIALAWVLFPVWGYFLFKRRAARHRW